MMPRFIEVIIDDSDTEDLLKIEDSDLDALDAGLVQASVGDNLTMTVRNGVIHSTDGLPPLPVHNYSAKVASKYENEGDHFWVSYDGVGLNVSAMAAQLREAVVAARNGDE